MIFDKIANLHIYGFDLDFIHQDLDINNFQSGRNEINGDTHFYIGLEYQTKQASEALWEAHRKYLDIHVILQGEEYVEITDIGNMASIKEYEDDYELFEGNNQHKILLKEGYFLILFPHEVHKTSIKVNNSISVRKKVYKKLI